jgi:undecaprenyl pyrophosphate synthase
MQGEENWLMLIEQHKGLHVAIIMDGNGRWATRQGLPRVALRYKASFGFYEPFCAWRPFDFSSAV